MRLPLKQIWQATRRPPLRTIVPCGLLLLILGLAYLLWSPGKDITDGRHDLNRNGIWLQHGWLGDDYWFTSNQKRDQMSAFRNSGAIRQLADRLRANHITDVYPHLSPTLPTGRIPDVEPEQAERFLKEFTGFRVMPWIGGSAETTSMDDPAWRHGFTLTLSTLLREHPGFAGVHINIEPCRSGDTNFLTLLDEVRAVLPAGKILSVAAYPPPTRWQPNADIHWDRSYYEQVARRVDQMVIMMYDTGLHREKFYQQLANSWSGEALAWSGKTQVLLGVPAYEESHTTYHDPKCENLRNGLLAVHGALKSLRPLPDNYQGVAIYNEWEMDDAEWTNWRTHFLKAE